MRKVNKNKRRTKRFRAPPLSKLELDMLGNRVVRYGKDTSIVCQVPRTICPKSVMVRLTYPDTVSVRVPTTSPSGNWTIRGSAYDPDPSFGTGAVPGFAEWANFYNSFRIHGLGVRGQIANLESTPVMFVIVPNGGTRITNNTLNEVQLYEYAGNSLAYSSTLGAITGGESVQRVEKFWHYDSILGESQWLTDDGYAANVTGNPTTMINMLTGYTTLSGANFATGVGTHFDYDMDVEFYNRKLLTA